MTARAFFPWGPALMVSLLTIPLMTSRASAQAQPYSCGVAAASGPSLSPAQINCSSPYQTATWNAYCSGSPIFGGASFSNGTGSVSVQGYGSCTYGVCAPTFGIYQPSTSQVTAGVVNNTWTIFPGQNPPVPYCYPAALIYGSSYTCTASCLQCYIGVDSCATNGCSGSYSCVSGCCQAGGESGDGCTGDSDCDSGDICDDGTCVYDGGDGDGGGGDTNCFANDWPAESICNGSYCPNGCDATGCDCAPEDPIIIDLSGKGYVLTNATHGVMFDFAGKGTKTLTSWTAGGYNGGWLALDRNGNGKIDNGTELFGNLTAQPTPANGQTKNGFLALAVFDQPANGGNGDGIIDSHDAVYSKLLIWVDLNHNGISEPNELIPLAKAGVKSILLKYALGKWADAYGNVFRYESQASTAVSPTQPIYDVVLVQGVPNKNNMPKYMTKAKAAK